MNTKAKIELAKLRGIVEDQKAELKKKDELIASSLIKTTQLEFENDVLKTASKQLGNFTEFYKERCAKLEEELQNQNITQDETDMPKL